jgi:hypothetical protein
MPTKKEMFIVEYHDEKLHDKDEWSNIEIFSTYKKAKKYFDSIDSRDKRLMFNSFTSNYIRCENRVWTYEDCSELEDWNTRITILDTTL